ncbi:hypothetical protein C2S52_015054 [Perilla frutescens var. hirtella]|nr:hypothetical protein C2S52_015054 [Perilla frutescens var. hirtella]KAH6816132.1 hypothetical protein C2S51_020952 [Perilla frutescens var. frutescens]
MVFGQALLVIGLYGLSNSKGISYDYIEENLPEYKSYQLLHHNLVHKKVPILVHRGRAVADSTVILDYIEETWFENLPLMPQDKYERATTRFWIKFGQDKCWHLK